ncbi:hypothetical protein E2R62_09700 [Citrobacter rodentium]|uniref:Uncharacterized protein n=1 Tax=Citrobacter rodentium TaxID=67825 RepID=A0A482PF69_CITRO|nr:hypothetical protein E2R62_09700 [Citrobacter rodentium]HAT8013933.1 hypothetical protein [Citrobacter rodentium NBRC 105723 = DSM 16636]HAT8018963.1 hypothetical protein [Citrobacter rodentium]HAT8033798.1 hypothetical protein [Citrobacter rodentium]HAT8038577.1 hypothetical protein [Citrobacter rodentium]
MPVTVPARPLTQRIFLHTDYRLLLAPAVLRSTSLGSAAPLCRCQCKEQLRCQTAYWYAQAIMS